MFVAVTGYYGTGSSAVIDLLCEFKEFSVGGLNCYEHVPFYTPNGLFDLEDKLLIGNNLHRSDEAIYSFSNAMNKLNKNNFGWFGGYSKRYGSQFEVIVNEFIENIIDCELPGNWSYTYLKLQLSLWQCAKDTIKKALKIPLYKNFGQKVVFDKEHILKYTFADDERFYKYGKEFVENYMEMIGQGEKNIVFDHLILPHNLHRIKKYFGDDFRAIVVERDIRDLFVLSKYVWPSTGASAPIPKDIDEFIKFWRGMRRIEQPEEDKRILRVQFEDLVYKYEDTVKIIKKFVGINGIMHSDKYTKFIPEKSIKNTQNFRIRPEWEDEIKRLEIELPEYIYKFPYEINTSLKETFA